MAGISQTRNAPNASNRHDPLACAFWMMLSCTLFAGLTVIGRYVTTTGVPPFQVIFLRVIFALATDDRDGSWLCENVREAMSRRK